MPLKTLVKVGSLTNLSEARYCAGMDVQLLGFQTVPARPNYISPMRFQEIRGWITGPSIVAEVYGVQSRDELNAIVEAYRPDYLELARTELHHADHLSIPFILHAGRNEGADLPVQPAYVLADAGDIDYGKSPVIVRVSSIDEAQSVLKAGRASGIALQGSDEISPGLKTYDTLAPILEILEDDN